MSNNLQEKLELMQWLFERGFEPRMWFSMKSNTFASEKQRLMYATVVDQDKVGCYIEHNHPWFPLEQVLELLGQRRWFEIDPQSILLPITHKYLTQLDIEVGLDSDYHLAALKLLKQVVEQFPEEVGK